MSYSCRRLDINNKGKDIMVRFFDHSKEHVGCVKAKDINHHHENVCRQ
jgi:hypothetical protein